MGEPVIQASFAGGELSPSMYARVDLAKYHVGAALLRNFFVDYRGGAANRAGTQFIGCCVDSTTANRLIPFTFSSTQAYALVFGNFTMRILYVGAELLNVAKPVENVTNANPGVFFVAFHQYPVGSTVIIGGTAYLIGGATIGTFTLTDLFGNPIDTTSWGAYAGNLTAASVYTIATPYAAADLALLKWVQSADTMTLVHPAYAPRALTRNADATWSINVISFAPQGDAPTNLVGSFSVTQDNPSPVPTEYDYVVTAIGANGATESRPSNSVGVVVPCPMSKIASSVTLGWQGVVGASAYNIYRTAENPGLGPVPGALFGFVGTVSAQATNRFTDTDIKPDFSNCPPQPANPFQIGSIKSIPVTAAGSGYTSGATITITDPTGYGAVATPILDGNGAVTGVNILSGGQNYTNPVATIYDGAVVGPDPGLPTGGDGGDGGTGGGSGGGGGGGGGSPPSDPGTPVPGPPAVEY